MAEYSGDPGEAECMGDPGWEVDMRESSRVPCNSALGIEGFKMGENGGEKVEVT